MKTLRYVVCFYWQGERWQEHSLNSEELSDVTQDISFQNHLRRVGAADRKLVELYVNNLYLGVLKWAVHPFRFVCFTNERLSVLPEIEVRPFVMVSRRGVLPRAYMFSRQAGLFGHRVLAMDIDVVVVGSLEEMMDYEGLFAVRESWSRAEWGLPDGDVMSFRAGPETERMFWKPLIADVPAAERLTQGRERLWIRHCTNNKVDLFRDVLPGQVVSLKHHVRQRDYLPNKLTRIVSCHGYPRPHQIHLPWLEENFSYNAEQQLRRYEQFKNANQAVTI